MWFNSAGGVAGQRATTYVPVAAPRVPTTARDRRSTACSTRHIVIEENGRVVCVGCGDVGACSSPPAFYACGRLLAPTPATLWPRHAENVGRAVMQRQSCVFKVSSTQLSGQWDAGLHLSLCFELNCCYMNMNTNPHEEKSPNQWLGKITILLEFPLGSPFSLLLFCFWALVFNHAARQSRSATQPVLQLTPSCQAQDAAVHRSS